MAFKRQDIRIGGINHYIVQKCPQCGKTFEHTQEWAFWRGYSKRKTFFCSWGCVRAHDAKHPAKRAYSRATDYNTAREA